jgi:hypothetical protein
MRIPKASSMGNASIANLTEYQSTHLKKQEAVLKVK